MSRAEKPLVSTVRGSSVGRQAPDRAWPGWLRDCLVTLVFLLGSPISNADHKKDTVDLVQAATEEANAPQESLSDKLGSLLGGSESEFLDPEVAYILSVEAASSQTVVVRFDIAEGYYLYRDKLHFGIEDTSSIALADVVLPPGIEKVDQYFGAMEVYYERVAGTLQFDRPADAPGELALTVSYQGCADAGLCYPPMTKTVSVFFPDADAASVGQSSTIATDAEFVGVLPEQDRIARSLTSGNTGLGVRTVLRPRR